MCSGAAHPLHAASATSLALLVALLPLHVSATISTVGFTNRYYRGHGYKGSRVLEHNRTGRFERYVEVNWTQSASQDSRGRVWVADRVRHTIVLVHERSRYIGWQAFYDDFAGSVSVPGHFDGYRLQAQFNGPMGLVVSTVAGKTNFIYVADSNNHCIRRIDLTTDRISTIVGGPGLKGLRDGPGMEARFNAPMSLGIDSTGMVLFALDNIRLVRYIDLSRMIPVVTTLIGGACRAVSRHVEVASIVIRRVGCHPDWRASDEGTDGSVPELQQYSQTLMCVGHAAMCNPRHHPAFADSRAQNRYEAPAATPAAPPAAV